MPLDPDATHTSRARLLGAGRTLFSKNGYEQTSTAAIAREAGSSESQLIRYFGGKSGLLEAIFNESWGGLNEAIRQQVTEAPHGREAIQRILHLVVEVFGRDHELAFLFLFEGRRIRGGSSEVVLSDGFRQFYQLVGGLIRRGQEDGSFRSDLDVSAMGAAMLGAAEGMIRDRLIAERTGRANPYDDGSVRAVFEALTAGFAPTR